MTPHIVQIMTLCCATAQLVAASVMAVYARHRVQYLALSWVNGIFGFILLGEAFFSETIATFPPGILNPVILLSLLAGVFLQSIYPLSIPLPGFLQWGRMWRYASPIFLLLLVYAFTLPFSHGIVYLMTWSELLDHLFSVDVLCRLAAVGLCIYYIVNIFRLPHLMAQKSNVPHYLLGYCTALGLSVLFYLYMVLFYDILLVMVYHVIFTVLNLYLVFRTMETIALELPQPSIETVEETPVGESEILAENDDFNVANQQRFHRIQYWMQNHSNEWMDSTFGRDRLCKEVGMNRHLLLQSVRSQGHNNVHDYINRYRLEELKRLIRRGEVRSVQEATITGLGTTKTARSCFLKFEGITLDSYLHRYARTTKDIA